MPEDLPESSSRSRMHSVGDYYSAVQLRSDRWSALREVVDGLSHLGPGDAGAGTLASRAEELFEALSPIEMYWAFPGLAAFDHMRRQLDHRNWEDLAFSVRRVVRALTSGAYRRRTIPLARGDGDAEEIEDEATLPIEARIQATTSVAAAPGFTVIADCVPLIVPVTVSVTVTDCSPTLARVIPPLKVCTPLSAPINV